MKKRTIAYMLGAVSGLLILWGLWASLCSPTKVAFMNYQAIQLGEIARANDNGMVKLYELQPSEASRAGRYDMLFINGMGLRITEEERAAVQHAADKGLPVISTMVTNPANDINTLDSADVSAVKSYLENGGPDNYRNMLAYVRKYIDGKPVFAPEPSPAEIYEVENIYRPSSDGDGELGFGSIAEYEEYLKLCQDSSNYKVDVELNAQSQIVSLSTCTNVRDDERFLVQGVLTATD